MPPALPWPWPCADPSPPPSRREATTTLLLCDAVLDEAQPDLAAVTLDLQARGLERGACAAAGVPAGPLRCGVCSPQAAGGGGCNRPRALPPLAEPGNLWAPFAAPPHHHTHHHTRTQMLSIVDGKERTKAEWTTLLAGAGWRLRRVHRLRAMPSLVEAVPV